MVSTVKSRANHYEALGLTPAASEEEIARAFATKVSPFRPHGVSDLAQVSLAYETLRNPAKRRAYDASLGITPEPAPIKWKRDGWPFVASARAGAPEQPVIDQLPRPSRPASAQPRPEPPAEPRTTPFLSASSREPVEADRSETRATAVPVRAEAPGPPEPEASLRHAPQGMSESALLAELEECALQAEDDTIQWKRPALIAGGLLLGVGLLGAWVGSMAGNEVEAQEPAQAQAVTLPVPEAEADEPATAALPAVTPTVAEERPEPRTRAPAVETARIARTQPPPQPAVPEVEQAEATQPDPSRIEDIAAGLAVAEAPAAEAADAKLPLPNSVVARTIRRIGYSCGEVASTTAIDGGAPGSFKVTCTSGDSYRAAPVRGRYHFRRWDRR